MKIAVLSGKGGTGKTLLSVNLAAAACLTAAAGRAAYIDCDVEEPNGYLFFKPLVAKTESIAVKIPEVDKERCSSCRKCVDFCKFNALAFIRGKPLVFEEVCHSCGGCVLICPEKALSEREKVIGTIEDGYSGAVFVRSGTLNVGEVSGVPIIRKLLGTKPDEETVFIDCPPGSACIVMESIRDADYCVLVAEPTAFGAQNLEMVYELVTLFKKPFGVVLNKCLDGENPSERFCLEKGIKILGRIPFDSTLGKRCSDAEIAVRADERYHALFSDLLNTVMKEAGSEAASHIER